MVIPYIYQPVSKDMRNDYGDIRRSCNIQDERSDEQQCAENYPCYCKRPTVLSFSQRSHYVLKYKYENERGKYNKAKTEARKNFLALGCVKAKNSEGKTQEREEHNRPENNALSLCHLPLFMLPSWVILFLEES